MRHFRRDTTLACDTVRNYCIFRAIAVFGPMTFRGIALSYLSAQSDKYMTEVNRLAGSKVTRVIATRATRWIVASRISEIAATPGLR